MNGTGNNAYRKRWKAGIFLILSLLIAGTMTGCQGNSKTRIDLGSSGVTESGQEAQRSDKPVFGDFKAQTIDGTEVDQEIFADADLTMVNIWGTFCGPCIREMPDLGVISRNYADKKVKIVGIISDVAEPNDESALSIIEQTKADYMHLVASEDLVNNYLSLVQVVPTTVFVDSEGKMVGKVYSGSKTRDKWEEIIDSSLETVKNEK